MYKVSVHWTEGTIIPPTVSPSKLCVSWTITYDETIDPARGGIWRGLTGRSGLKLRRTVSYRRRYFPKERTFGVTGKDLNS